MARRTARTPGYAQEIELELVAGPERSSPWPGDDATVVELGLPWRRGAGRLRSAADGARRRHAVVIGAHRGFNPRRQSVVEHRVRGAAADVAARLTSDVDAYRFPGGGLEAPASGPLAYDPVEHEYRLPAGMHVAWAWPDLPVWLGVAELSGTTCLLRLSLRSRRRLRYPVRYFHAAHCALSAVEGRVGSAAP